MCKSSNGDGSAPNGALPPRCIDLYSCKSYTDIQSRTFSSDAAVLWHAGLAVISAGACTTAITPRCWQQFTRRFVAKLAFDDCRIFNSKVDVVSCADVLGNARQIRKRSSNRCDSELLLRHNTNCRNNRVWPNSSGAISILTDRVTQVAGAFEGDEAATDTKLKAGFRFQATSVLEKFLP